MTQQLDSNAIGLLIETLKRAEQASEELCQGQHPGNECHVTLSDIRAKIGHLEKMRLAQSKGPYSATHTSKSEAPYVFGISGPGDGIGYYAWYGHPENTCETMAEAEKIARLMNLAYVEGMKARSRQIAGLLQ